MVFAVVPRSSLPRFAVLFACLLGLNLALANPIVSSDAPRPVAIFEATSGRQTPLHVRTRAVTAALHADASISFLLRAQANGEQASFRMRFLDAAGNVTLAGERALPRPVLYLREGEQRPVAVPAYYAARYRGVYPGIDIRIYGVGDNLEYDVEAAPGADLQSVRIAFDGAAVALEENGALELKAGGRTVMQMPPVAFEVDSTGTRRRVPCTYDLHDGSFSFQTERSNANHHLIIDPVLNFSGALGGSGFDAVLAMRTDSDGNVYLAGDTDSSEIWVPPAGSLRNAVRDAWVMKLDRESRVLYRVVVSGSGNDVINAIDVDRRGNLYAAGTTSSPTLGGFFGSGAGLEDAFALKLSATGAPQWGTYVGGLGADFGWAAAAGPGGSLILAGQSSSSSLPATSTGYRASNAGGLSDCFVSRISGGVVQATTFLGGAAIDLCRAVAVDASGAVVAAGATGSANFPLQSPLKAVHGGNLDAFVARLSGNLGALLYSTYIGGAGIDEAYALALDPVGDVYFAGSTTSSAFPTTAGAVQTTLAGGYDGFLVKLAANGQSYRYATLLGGAGDDVVTALAVDPAGRMAVAGFTTSSNLPVLESIMPFGGYFDAFAAVIGSSPPNLEFLTYFGGTGDDRALAVGFCARSTVCFAGSTDSPSFPVTGEAGTPEITDGFVARVTYASPLVTAQTRAFVWQDAESQQAVAAFTGGENGLQSLGAAAFSGLDPDPWRLAGAGDFNGDGIRDLVWQNADGRVKVSYLTGAMGTAVSSWGWLSPEASADWRLAAVADVNRDGKPDLVFQHSQGQIEARLFGGTSGTTLLGTAALGTAPSASWNVAGLADFNGDGILDVLWQHAASKGLQIWLMTGAQGNILSGTMSLDHLRFSAWSVVAVADLNADSKPDLVWADDATGDILVSLMNGASVLGWARPDPPPFPAWRVRAVR
jgi:hypothetical protein